MLFETETMATALLTTTFAQHRSNFVFQARLSLQNTENFEP